MNYTLTHKNAPVAELEIDEEVGAISRIGEIPDPAHLPVGWRKSGSSRTASAL
jgi:hypothetical protein